MALNPFPADREITLNTATDMPPAVMHGLRLKRQIIRDVIDGHLPLLQAAAKFEVLHRPFSARMARVTGVPVANDGESICRTVIGWVSIVLADRPEQAERISERLEQELQKHLEQHGEVNLPRVS